MVKRTYQPSKVRRIRMYGFRARLKKSGGRSVLRRRMKKGRRAIAVS